MWLSSLECCPVSERLGVPFPVRAHTYLGCGFDPWSRRIEEASIDVSLSHRCVSLSLPLSLPAMETCPWVRIKERSNYNDDDICP